MNDFMKVILNGIKTAFYLKSESDARYFKKYGEDDAINLLAKMDMITPVTNDAGDYFTDNKGNILFI